MFSTRSLSAAIGLGRAARRAALINKPPVLPAQPLAREDIDQTAEILENAPTREDQQVATYSVHEDMPKHLRPTKFVRLSDFKDKAWQRLPRKPDPFGPGRDESESRDAFVQLQLDPLHESTNARMLAHFVTDMGRIRKRAQTGLTWRSQRRMAKAVRRAKMMGLMPILRRDNPYEDRADSLAKRYR